MNNGEFFGGVTFIVFVGAFIFVCCTRLSNPYDVDMYMNWNKKQCEYIELKGEKLPCDKLRKDEKFNINWVRETENVNE